MIELTAIYEAIKYFKSWIEERNLLLKTDYKPLIYAFQQRSEGLAETMEAAGFYRTIFHLYYSYQRKGQRDRGCIVSSKFYRTTYSDQHTRYRKRPKR